MPVEHIVIAEQTGAWKTGVTPDTGIYVNSWSIDPGLSHIDVRTSGRKRGLANKLLGSKLVTGSFEMPFWMENMGLLMKMAWINDIASTVQGATAAYQHGFLPDDATIPYGLSVQAQQDADDGMNLLGVLFNTLTFNCQAGEMLLLSGDYIAADEARVGENWDHTATASPSFVASPTYQGDDILPLTFVHGALLYDATLTWNNTENVFTKVGGTELTVEMVELTLNNNLDPRVFLGSRVAGNVVGQDRVITGRFDLDFSTVTNAIYDLYRAGTKKTLWLEFDSGIEAAVGYNYKLIVVVPNIMFTSAAPPDIQGSQDRRMQSIEFEGLVDSDDVEFNVQLIDTATSY